LVRTSSAVRGVVVGVEVATAIGAGGTSPAYAEPSGSSDHRRIREMFRNTFVWLMVEPEVLAMDICGRRFIVGSVFVAEVETATTLPLRRNVAVVDEISTRMRCVVALVVETPVSVCDSWLLLRRTANHVPALVVAAWK
jgi:hypothetical protein